MKVALINSRQDKAGVNIRHHIEEMLNTGMWKEHARSYEFIEVEERLIHAEHVDRRTDADLLIFLSRHSSVHPVPGPDRPRDRKFQDSGHWGNSPHACPCSDGNDAGHPPHAVTALS